MTTYNTGNPIGSVDVKDLYDNAQNLDIAMQTPETTWVDRLGVTRRSWAGATGYDLLGDYASGIEVTSFNQIIRDPVSGEFWRASAGTELPYVTTGAGMPEGGAFVPVGDAVLRQDLATSDNYEGGAAIVANAPIVLSSVSDMPGISGPVGRAFIALDQQGGGSVFSLEPVGAHVVDDGMVFAAGAGLVFVRKSDHVAPEFFGNAINNLIPAAQAAVRLGLPLRTGPNVYALDTSFLAPDGLVWHCNDTKITQNSDRADAAGFAPGSNTVQTGRLTVTMGEYPGPGVGRAAVKIDDTQNRVPVVSNVTLDTIVCLGGHNNANGVVAMGGANGIRIKRIVCPDSAKYGRPFMAHWGNFQDHYYDAVAGVYRHVPGALPTTHPNNIVIDEIECGTLSYNAGDVAAAFLSAAFDVEIKKVSANISSAATNASIVTLSAGDLGFAYSNLITVRMRNIKIGSISGTTTGRGYQEIGTALYASADETPQPASSYLAWIDANILSIDARGISTAGNQNYCVTLTNGEGRTHINHVRAQDFFRVVFAGNRSSNVFVDLVSAKDTRDNVLHLLGYGSDSTLFPRSYYFGRVELDDYGRSNVSGEGRRAIRVNRMLGVFIESVYLNQAGSGTDILLSDTSSGGKGVGIGNIFVLDPSYVLTYVITNQNPNSDPIYVGNVVDVSGSVTTAGSGGSYVTHRGRFREFSVFGGSVPAGLTVNVGDRILAQSANAGQVVEWYVTGAGVTGSGATTAAIVTRP